MGFGPAGRVPSPESAGTAALGAVVVRAGNSPSPEDEGQNHAERELPMRARPRGHEHGAAVRSSMLQLRLGLLKTSRILFVVGVISVSALLKTEV